ncbi:uncharacterized protein LOC131043604 [Cryptomeria japonica]|uniref:uncharacterized protein LOC131043604 n=1 Tax=Cryptomeria japonica TaxID=3369 RepID=UPI0027DA7977|nr:uncharacterized protein LOC131043604 [Cryptomeria japonica]
MTAMKDLTTKKKVANGNTSAKDGHAKMDKSNTSGKPEKVNAIGDLLETTADKKTSHQKVDKGKAHSESNSNSAFDMTEALTQMKVTVPLCTNNIAEYETLLLGLEIAKKHGIQLLRVFGDSKLLVSQIRSKYASKNDRLKKYKHAIWDVIEYFDAFSIDWIQRSKNIMLDFLANVALKNDDVTLTGVSILEIKAIPAIQNNVYNWFIANFAEIVKPIVKLLKKDAKFSWDEEATQTFDKIKRAIQEAPMLKSPDYNKAFSLFSFASHHTIATILLQKDDEGYAHPISFKSKSLQVAELKYEIMEKQAYDWSRILKHSGLIL